MTTTTFALQTHFISFLYVYIVGTIACLLFMYMTGQLDERIQTMKKERIFKKIRKRQKKKEQKEMGELL
jgi:hypothetical protein